MNCALKECYFLTRRHINLRVIILFSIKIKDIKFGVSFSFFAVIGLLFVCGRAMTENIFTALICCFLHELGHLTFMFLFSDKPESIVLYGGGIRIKSGGQKLLPQNREIIILLAGCGANFLCALVRLAFGGLDFFCTVNILLGVFNLLPFKYFDGGRVLEILLKGGRTYDLIRALFIFLWAVCVILMILNGSVSLSFILTFCFVVISEILY